MNSNKRKLVEEFKKKGHSPKKSYDLMRAHEAIHGRIIGKRKEKKSEKKST